MSLYGERTMPIVRAEWRELPRSWLVLLPGGVALEAASAADAEELVRRHAPGSSIQFARPVFGGGAVEASAPQRATGSSPEDMTPPG